MTNKGLLITAGALFLAGLGVMAGTYYMNLNKEQVVTPAPYIAPEPIVNETKPIAPVLGDQATIERYARIVVLRVGSFKNDDLTAVDTLKPIFDNDVFSALKRVRNKAIQNEDKGVEAVVSTVSFDKTKVETDKAEVMVKGQQIRTKSGQSENKDLNVKLEFSKVEGSWVISKFSL